MNTNLHVIDAFFPEINNIIHLIKTYNDMPQ